MVRKVGGAYKTLLVQNVTSTSGLTGLSSSNFAIDVSAGTVRLTGIPAGNGGVFSFDVVATDFADAPLSKHYDLSVFKFAPFVQCADGRRFDRSDADDHRRFADDRRRRSL